MDRDFGWTGKYLFHGIIEFHVVHHLFSSFFLPLSPSLSLFPSSVIGPSVSVANGLTSNPRRIPFYRAEEATRAIIPLLGDAYHTDKQRAFLPALWESFVECQWVEAGGDVDADVDVDDGVR